LGSLTFLREYNAGVTNKTDFRGKKVAVIGGGNAAMDVARTSLRLGAAAVHVIYRREKEAMPALAEEINAGEKEGIKFHFLLIPQEIRGENGKVKELDCLFTKPGDFDSSGRRKPVPTGEKFVLPVDIVVSAIGSRPALPDSVQKELSMRNNGTVIVDGITLAATNEGIFAGGDLVTGGGTVIESIADGEKAAISIDRYLRGENLAANRFVIKGERKEVSYIDPAAEVKPQPRYRNEELEPAARAKVFAEVELGYTRRQARCEAKRCLRCDRQEAVKTNE
jgi:NADPH-dependent glutamate synthase beta subunit-like oxidoreductase